MGVFQTGFMSPAQFAATPAGKGEIDTLEAKGLTANYKWMDDWAKSYEDAETKAGKPDLLPQALMGLKMPNGLQGYQTPAGAATQANATSVSSGKRGGGGGRTWRKRFGCWQRSSGGWIGIANNSKKFTG